ncbi:hypothetical protein LUZ60_008219 [Juncus effusus]|nr:hypothetical protein LUZ60_008219 [Juncus effusus]
MKTKQNYAVKKNWMGDPCSPKNYTWEGVGCKYTAGTPIIISLNLSSSSLNGSISDSFFSLKSIQILDLSNNHLSGDVPDSLANMPSLQVLNCQEVPLQIVARQFVYKELKYVTNNFERVIGKGGFGTVYYGKLDDVTEVAVKLRHESSSQGVREFLSEDPSQVPC